jgi:phosphatidylserine/phosphatidylglycerophosphate/cardiolipin synthase-like enzyme
MAPIFVHSKLRIIDDLYLSVGSGNMNNRGYKFEGEMNIAIVDKIFVQEQRQKVFAALVGEYHAPYLNDDPINNFEVFRLAAEQNHNISQWWEANQWDLTLEEAQEEWEWWKPSGFLFPLTFSDDYIEVVGPDVF